MENTPEYKKLLESIKNILSDQDRKKIMISKAVTINGLLMDYARMLIKDVVREHCYMTDPMLVIQSLEKRGLLKKSDAFNYVSLISVLEKYGWTTPLTQVDNSKLIHRYRVGENNIKVQSWFNASVCQYNGHNYMAYRVDAEPWTVNTRVAFCELDSNWQPIADSNWIVPLPFCDTFAEDPRLFIAFGKIYLSYVDGCQVGLAVIDPVSRSISDHLFIEKPYRKRMEKNWTFFYDRGNIYFVYRISPHEVYRMDPSGKITQVYDYSWLPPESWKWGWGSKISGGTNPVLHDGKYYCFFHSKVNFDANLKGRLHMQYHIGCYVFHPEKYTPLAMSKEPLISGFYPDPEVVTGGRFKSIVFPMSAIYNENGFWRITAGVNDSQIFHFDFDAKHVENNLVWL